MSNTEGIPHSPITTFQVCGMYSVEDLPSLLVVGFGWNPRTNMQGRPTASQRSLKMSDRWRQMVGVLPKIKFLRLTTWPNLSFHHTWGSDELSGPLMAANKKPAMRWASGYLLPCPQKERMRD